MRDQKQCRLRAGVQCEEKLGDFLAGMGIEIAGGFIGEQNARPRGNRAGQRHTLLLAAGELSRIVIETLAQTDRFQFRFRAVERIACAGQFQRHGDILQRGHGRDEMKRLKDDPDMPAAEAREFILAHPGDVRARDGNAALRGRFQSRGDHKKRRLARTGRAEQGDGLAGRHAQRHAGENVHRPGGTGQRESYVLQIDGGGHEASKEGPAVARSTRA